MGTAVGGAAANMSEGLLLNAYYVGFFKNLTNADRVCVPVPFYHCFGMVMGNLACSIYGSTMVVPCASLDPAAVLSAVQDEQCT